MTAAEVLRQMDEAGAKLSVVDSGMKLRVLCPPGAVSRDLLGLVKRHRDALIQMVAGRDRHRGFTREAMQQFPGSSVESHEWRDIA